MAVRPGIFLVFLGLLFISFSCSKEEAENTTDPDADSCTLPAPGTSCAAIFLQGSSGWTEIIDPGELEDPYFLYSPGSMTPRGTVTISLNSGSVLVRINDSEIRDLQVQVAQNKEGDGLVCEVLTGLSDPGSDQEADAMITLQGEFSYPFQLKIKANECI